MQRTIAIAGGWGRVGKSAVLCCNITARVCGKVIESVFVSVCAITFECLNIETSFLVGWDILTISR